LSTLGILSNASSRFIVEVEPLVAGNVGDVQALQLMPGQEGSRLIRFQFTDSTSGRAYTITITYADAAFEAFDVFGGKKSAGDKADEGAF
jgi:hypothetical protein